VGTQTHFLWLTKLRQKVSDDRAVPASKKSSKKTGFPQRGLSFLSGIERQEIWVKMETTPNRHAFINQTFTRIEKVKIYSAQPSSKITGPRFPRENF
jgi:hypothetical protein